MRWRAPGNCVYLDPVAAYGRIASEFQRLSEQRRAYLTAIEQLVIARMPRGARTLLDVGAGDGSRSVRIARACGITDLVLLEPSPTMRAALPPHARLWAMRAQDLRGETETFDAIICLWNVLGHVFPAAARRQVMGHFARLLSPGGRVFIDLNHRYNLPHYGPLPTALRMLRDRLQPSETAGDVKVTWEAGGGRYTTDGHVFTDPEFRQLAQRGGLVVETMLSVSYANGGLRRSKYSGNLFYVLRRAQ